MKVLPAIVQGGFSLAGSAMNQSASSKAFARQAKKAKNAASVAHFRNTQAASRQRAWSSNEAHRSRRFSATEASKARSYNAQQAALAREFNALEASKARGFTRNERVRAQEYATQMASTEIQRRVADAVDAGVHPLFALGSSMSVSPAFTAGAQAAGSAASVGSAGAAGAPGGAAANSPAAQIPGQSWTGSVAGDGLRAIGQAVADLLRGPSPQEIALRADAENSFAQASYYRSLAATALQGTGLGAATGIEPDWGDSPPAGPQKDKAAERTVGMVSPQGNVIPQGPGADAQVAQDRYGPLGELLFGAFNAVDSAALQLEPTRQKILKALKDFNRPREKQYRGPQFR